MVTRVSEWSLEYYVGFVKKAAMLFKGWIHECNLEVVELLKKESYEYRGYWQSSTWETWIMLDYKASSKELTHALNEYFSS
jgi:hypothetical protein